MTDILRSNFQVEHEVSVNDSEANVREQFRKRALESISGSMVFVEDCVLYWDLADE